MRRISILLACCFLLIGATSDCVKKCVPYRVNVFQTLSASPISLATAKGETISIRFNDQGAMTILSTNIPQLNPLLNVLIEPYSMWLTDLRAKKGYSVNGIKYIYDNTDVISIYELNRYSGISFVFVCQQTQGTVTSYPMVYIRVRYNKDTTEVSGDLMTKKYDHNPDRAEIENEFGGISL